MKNTKQTIKYLLCAAISCVGFSGFCWDNPGHMSVAGLAFDELSSAQQTKLVAIIKQHPDLHLVTRGFPGASPDGRDLVMAVATWPDLIKQDRADYEDVGYEEKSPAVTTVTFDHKMHKGWHFIDNPLWLENGAAPQLPDVPQANAVGVVNVLMKQLQSDEPDKAKAYDLGWLLHLVGDLHQPLHSVTDVTPTYPAGDQGGNKVKVHGVKGETELHAVWDDILGKSAPADRKTHLPRLDKDLATANDIVAGIQNEALGANADNLDPSTWADESMKIAKEDAYNLNLQVVSGDQGDGLSAEIDDSYLQGATVDAKQRLRLAGHRLALILKQDLQ